MNIKKKWINVNVIYSPKGDTRKFMHFPMLYQLQEDDHIDEICLAARETVAEYFDAEIISSDWAIKEIEQ